MPSVPSGRCETSAARRADPVSGSPAVRTGVASAAAMWPPRKRADQLLQGLVQVAPPRAGWGGGRASRPRPVPTSRQAVFHNRSKVERPWTARLASSEGRQSEAWVHPSLRQRFVDLEECPHLCGVGIRAYFQTRICCSRSGRHGRSGSCPTVLPQAGWNGKRSPLRFRGCAGALPLLLRTVVV